MFTICNDLPSIKIVTVNNILSLIKIFTVNNYYLPLTKL